jgi:ribosome-binding ATPase YchF (GTP1/OBG family)
MQFGLACVCVSSSPVCRGFKDSEIEHVEGSVDPVRDLDIITTELQKKDLEKATARLDVVKKAFERGQDKSKKQDVLTITAAKELLESGKDIRHGTWKNDGQCGPRRAFDGCGRS